MWKKIKGILAVIGAVLTVAFCTFVLVFLRRRDSDGQRSGRIDEYDTRITEGIESSQGRINSVEGRITTVEESVGRCEERLHRAEEILRNAIRRSRKEDETIDQNSDSDVRV